MNKLFLHKKLNDAREEGIQIGEERGKIEVAKNLLKAGVFIDIVSKSTGLSVDEVTGKKPCYS